MQHVFDRRHHVHKPVMQLGQHSFLRLRQDSRVSKTHEVDAGSPLRHSIVCRVQLHHNSMVSNLIEDTNGNLYVVGPDNTPRHLTLDSGLWTRMPGR